MAHELNINIMSIKLMAFVGLWKTGNELLAQNMKNPYEYFAYIFHLVFEKCI